MKRTDISMLDRPILKKEKPLKKLVKETDVSSIGKDSSNNPDLISNVKRLEIEQTNICLLNVADVQKELEKQKANEHIEQTNISLLNTNDVKKELKKQGTRLNVEQTNISLLNIVDVQAEMNKRRK